MSHQGYWLLCCLLYSITQISSLQGRFSNQEQRVAMDRLINDALDHHLDQNDLYSQVQLLLKRAPFNGMRGKRAPFNGMRGKREGEAEYAGYDTVGQVPENGWGLGEKRGWQRWVCGNERLKSCLV